MPWEVTSSGEYQLTGLVNSWLQLYQTWFQEDTAEGRLLVDSDGSRLGWTLLAAGMALDMWRNQPESTTKRRQLELYYAAMAREDSGIELLLNLLDFLSEEIPLQTLHAWGPEIRRQFRERVERGLAARYSSASDREYGAHDQTR
jgi:hypothetical protein